MQAVIDSRYPTSGQDLASLVLLPIAFISPVLAVFLSLLTFVKVPTARGARYTAVLFGTASALVCYGITYTDLTVDAIRLMNECKSAAGMSLFSALFITPCSGSSGLVVLNLWEWAIGKIGDLHLFQASAAFVGYTLIAWPLLDSYASGKCRLHGFLFVLAFVLMAIPTQAIVGNVRSTVVCIVGAAAIYYGVTRGGHSIAVLVVLILSCGVHFIGALPVAIWLFRRFVEEKPWLTGLAMLVAIFVISALALLLESYVSSFSYLSEFFQRLLLYQEGTEYDQMMAGSLATRLSQAASLCLVVLMLTRAAYSKAEGKLFAYAIVSACCFAAVTVVLVNVGSRLLYLPLLLCSYSMLYGDASQGDDNRMRQIRRAYGTIFLFDLSIFIFGFALSAYSWSFFLDTFYVQEIALSTLFFPSSLLL